MKHTLLILLLLCFFMCTAKASSFDGQSHWYGTRWDRSISTIEGSEYSWTYDDNYIYIMRTTPNLICSSSTLYRYSVIDHTIEKLNSYRFKYLARMELVNNRLFVEEWGVSFPDSREFKHLFAIDILKHSGYSLEKVYYENQRIDMEFYKLGDDLVFYPFFYPNNAPRGSKAFVTSDGVTFYPSYTFLGAKVAISGLCMEADEEYIFYQPSMHEFCLHVPKSAFGFTPQAFLIYEEKLYSLEFPYSDNTGVYVFNLSSNSEELGLDLLFETKSLKGTDIDIPLSAINLWFSDGRLYYINGTELESRSIDSISEGEVTVYKLDIIRSLETSGGAFIIHDMLYSIERDADQLKEIALATGETTVYNLR